MTESTSRMSKTSYLKHVNHIEGYNLSIPLLTEEGQNLLLKSDYSPSVGCI